MRWSPQSEGSLCFKHSTASWRESDNRPSGQDSWGLVHLPLGASSGTRTNYFVIPIPLTWLQIFSGCLPVMVAFTRQKGLHPETIASVSFSVMEGTAGVGPRAPHRWWGSFPGPSEAHAGLLSVWLRAREDRPLPSGGGGPEAGGLGRQHSDIFWSVALEW